MKITVTTPTGQIGSQVADDLLKRGMEITVLARDADKVAALAARGAHVITGDQADPSVLNLAAAGSDTLFWVTPPNYTAANVMGHYNHVGRALGEVMQRKPDLRVLDISSIGGELDKGTGPIKGTHHIEDILNSTGRDLTHLRAHYFMENALSAMGTIAEHNSIFSTMPGSTPFSQVATRDIAARAVELLLDGVKGKRIEYIFGPAEITMAEVAAEFSRVIGKTVTHVQVPEEVLRGALIGAGFSEDVTKEFLEMYHAMATGLLKPVAGIPVHRGSTSIAQFAKEVFLPAYRHKVG